MIRAIAWDFDGVLNRCVENGRFLWAENFERDTGQSLAGFQRAVFGESFCEVIEGREDLADRVRGWCEAVGHAPGAEALIDYWFKRDDNPDEEMQVLLARLKADGLAQVIATNNEARRAAYIREQTDWMLRVDGLFCSGELGVGKPEAGFFEAVSEALSVPPAECLFVDDTLANVQAAGALGWQAFHFTPETRGRLAAVIAGEDASPGG
ncbi:HAD family phosphatase [Vannielia litorea]|uniref:HAD family hydrolase n=1 Tax=Vannielia litorea TaxID=1217970 RepID=UPI001C97C6C7|nr:HAD family phosphatase [Vannielia litorea]MBY6154770.1 HAD family phosphatase [Vannielia litorea]